jgi:hypothetical protein
MTHPNQYQRSVFIASHHGIAVPAALRRQWTRFAASQRGTSVPARRRYRPRVAVPGGLLTADQAAAKLACSIKTLNGHVKAGELKYVTIGHGKKRPRKMFTDADLDGFIAAQTKKDSPACPSDATRARRIGNTDSSFTVVPFTVRPKSRPGGKRRR